MSEDDMPLNQQAAKVKAIKREREDSDEPKVKKKVKSEKIKVFQNLKREM